MPVYNNEYQRIDDVSNDRISYGIQSLETHELFDCFVQALWACHTSVFFDV